MDPDSKAVWSRIVAAFRRRYKRGPYPGEAIRLKNILRLASERHRTPLKWVVEAINDIADADPLSRMERRLTQAQARAQARADGTLNRPSVALSKGGYCPDAYLVVLGGFGNDKEETRLVPVKRYGSFLLLETGGRMRVRNDQHFVPLSDMGIGPRISAEEVCRATSDDLITWSDIPNRAAVADLP